MGKLVYLVYWFAVCCAGFKHKKQCNLMWKGATHLLTSPFYPASPFAGYRGAGAYSGETPWTGHRDNTGGLSVEWLIQLFCISLKCLKRARATEGNREDIMSSPQKRRGLRIKLEFASQQVHKDNRWAEQKCHLKNNTQQETLPI